MRFKFSLLAVRQSRLSVKGVRRTQAQFCVINRPFCKM